MKNKIYIIALGIMLGFAGCKSQEKATRSLEPEVPEEVSYMKQLESTAQLIEAGKQKMLGNYSSAILLYAEAVKVDPANSAAYYELAKLHAEQGYMEDAEKYALQAVRLDPDNKYFNMALADIYFVQKKNEQGLEVQSRLAERYPTDLNIQISKLSTLLYMEKFEDAVRVMDYIEEISGFNNELSIQKQSIFMEMNRPDLALEEVKRLISYFPMELDYLQLLAELYQENDQPEEAYKVYKQMLKINPGYPMAHLLLADYYRKNGQEEKSFEELKIAFQSPQLEIEGKTRIMTSYYFLSEEDSTYLPQAYKLCEILVEIHPENAQVHAIYGDFLFRDKKNEEAWDRYHQAALLDPSELGYWQQVLSVEARLEDYNSMLNTSEKALEFFFEQPVLYFFNGLAHYQLKDYEKAIEAFKYGKDLSVGEPELLGQFLTLMGDAYHKTGDYPKSYQHYDEALELNPDDAYALNNYSYYLSMQNENLEKASKMSARSLELEPENSSFQDTYGWIQYKMGDYEQAHDWLKKSLDNSEKPNVVVLEHYGDVLYKLGRKEEARVYWQKALELEKQTEEDEEGASEFLEKKVEEGTLIE